MHNTSTKLDVSTNNAFKTHKKVNTVSVNINNRII